MVYLRFCLPTQPRKSASHLAIPFNVELVSDCPDSQDTFTSTGGAHCHQVKAPRHQNFGNCTCQVSVKGGTAEKGRPLSPMDKLFVLERGHGIAAGRAQGCQHAPRQGRHLKFTETE